MSSAQYCTTYGGQEEGPGGIDSLSGRAAGACSRGGGVRRLAVAGGSGGSGDPDARGQRKGEGAPGDSPLWTGNAHCGRLQKPSAHHLSPHLGLKHGDLQAKSQLLGAHPAGIPRHRRLEQLERGGGGGGPGARSHGLAALADGHADLRRRRSGRNVSLGRWGWELGKGLVSSRAQPLPRRALPGRMAGGPRAAGNRNHAAKKATAQQRRALVSQCLLAAAVEADRRVARACALACASPQSGMQGRPACRRRPGPGQQGDTSMRTVVLAFVSTMLDTLARVSPARAAATLLATRPL